MLISNARLVHKGHKLHGQQVNIQVDEQGMIEKVTASKKKGNDGLHVSPGWVDTQCVLNDPGYEYRDRLETLANSAARGGFTHLVTLPNTNPGICYSEAVRALLSRANGLPVSILPMGAATDHVAGEQMAELADMAKAGAVAFGDGLSPIQSSGVIYRILQYLQAIDGLLVQLPMMESLEAGGVANESPTITPLGLKPSPSLAEAMMVNLCIELLRHTGGKLHLAPISCRQSIFTIKKAKQEGLDVTAATAPQYLFYTDEMLKEFDARYKVRPPLRAEADRESLLEAVASGEIDLLCSMHSPANIDEKRLEFDYATFGMPMLETAFSAYNTALKGYTDSDHLVHLLSIVARERFKLPIPEIKKGEAACLTLYKPDEKWTVANEYLATLYNSNPLTGQTLNGKVVGTFHNGSYHSL